MLLQDDKIIATLNKVRIVREHLAHHCVAPLTPVLSVMNLHWAVQDIYALEITMLEISFQADFVGGNSERYDGVRARILVNSNLTHEMKRFVAVKELSHLMNDEKDEWSTLGVETIRGLMKEFELSKNNGEGHPTPTPALQSEMLALVAAIELIYPFEFRAADASKLAENRTTIARIALEHEAPAYIIELALENQDFFAQCWNAIEAEANQATTSAETPRAA